MVTRDVDIVVVADAVEATVNALEAAGFRHERFPWSINLEGDSAVSIQISTAASYRDFPARAVPADVHGILMRVASLDDTLSGKIEAWRDTRRRQSKRIKDLGDIARLVESHPRLWERLPTSLAAQIEQPGSGVTPD